VDQVEHPALTSRPVYLDYNATTPVDPRVVDVIQAALTTDFGNPSSSRLRRGTRSVARASARSGRRRAPRGSSHDRVHCQRH
jgi:cysteine desulfurase